MLAGKPSTAEGEGATRNTEAKRCRTAAESIETEGLGDNDNYLRENFRFF